MAGIKSVSATAPKRENFEPSSTAGCPLSLLMHEPCQLAIGREGDGAGQLHHRGPGYVEAKLAHDPNINVPSDFEFASLSAGLETGLIQGRWSLNERQSIMLKSERCQGHSTQLFSMRFCSMVSDGAWLNIACNCTCCRASCARLFAVRATNHPFAGSVADADAQDYQDGNRPQPFAHSWSANTTRRLSPSESRPPIGEHLAKGGLAATQGRRSAVL
jgi:hypothetical protein